MDPFHQASNPYGRLPIPGLLSVLARILTPSRAQPSAAQADAVALDDWNEDYDRELRFAAHRRKLRASRSRQVPVPPLESYPPEVFLTPADMALRRRRQGGEL